MTDNEIVKALECCNNNNCKECPYGKYNTSGWCCMPKLRKDTLDLINRLQAEIDRKDKIYIDLLKTSSERADIISSLQAENERLKNAYKQCAWERDIFAEDIKEEIKKDCSYLMLDIKTIKAEAHKEFAERLKEKATQKFDWNEYVEVEEIDNLLKELVGE